MAYSSRMQKNHLYSVFFAPRGFMRMADAGMQIAAHYLSPFDKLIGVIGDSGSGKSILINGMFPGLELTNDDDGVNVRPLPLLGVGEEAGFYTPHTYHVDIRFEMAFTQPHELAEAIRSAVRLGKRVVVEHFDLIYSALGMNAHLLIGVGEEILITRPNLFGPEPEDVRKTVYASIPYRRMVHTAEDLCEFVLGKQQVPAYKHADVRHGFILVFNEMPKIDIPTLEANVQEMIAADIPISYYDERHITIGEHKHVCTGPRVHVKSTGQIEGFKLLENILVEPITNNYLLVGLVGKKSEERISDLNKIIVG